jgi:hypothetical protein
MKYGKCFLCGEYGELETHHIFRCVGGASRTKSDKLGLTVDLCRWCHQAGPESAHRCAETDRELKRYGQKKAMLEQGWDKDTFIAEFGRNYLDEDDLAKVRELQEMEAYLPDREMTVEELYQELGGGWIREEPETAPAHRMECRKGFTVTVEVMPF